MQKMIVPLFCVLFFARPSVADNEGRFTCIAISDDGKTMAVGCEDASIKVWDVPSRQPRRILRGHAKTVNCVTFSHDGSIFASASRDGSIKLWDLRRKRGEEEQDTLAARPLIGDAVASISFSPDGRILAAGGDDGMVRLWDLENNRSERLLSHHGFIAAVEYSRNGKYLAVSDRDDVVTLWETANWTKVRSWTVKSSTSLCLSFSKNNEHLAIAGSEAVMLVALNKPGLPTRTMDTPKPMERIQSIGFMNDSKHLVSVSLFGLLIWNVDEANVRAGIVRPMGISPRLSVTPDDAYVVIAGKTRGGLQRRDEEVVFLGLK